MFFGSQVEAPVAVKTEDLKKKPECYGVFCLTYDLKAVSTLFFFLLLSLSVS